MKGRMTANKKGGVDCSTKDVAARGTKDVAARGSKDAGRFSAGRVVKPSTVKIMGVHRDRRRHQEGSATCKTC
jgi:hypothetical protein